MTRKVKLHRRAASATVHIGAILTTGSLVLADCQPQWDQLVGQPGANHWVRTMAVFDDGSGSALYVGGNFTQIGGIDANHIARWDGEQWSTLGDGLSNTPVAMVVFDDGNGPALYVAGFFAEAGDTTVNAIARWDGEEWSALGSGMGGSFPWIDALAVYDDGTGPALYAAGGFTQAGGAAASHVARWDGQQWSNLGLGVSERAYALQVHDDGSGQSLFIGGIFQSAGGDSDNQYVARWNGSQWFPVGSGVTGGTVRAFEVFDDGSGPMLYAGGGFTTTGGSVGNYLAKWNGTAWAALPTTVNWTVQTMRTFDDGSGPALYVGGLFDEAGGNPVGHIAQWNGAAWSDLDGGVAGIGNFAGYVHTLTPYDNGNGEALYVGGRFRFADGVEADRIAAWRACEDEACATGDLNFDGLVNGADLLILLAGWGDCDNPDDCLADLNNDGVVDGADLLILLSNWG